MRLQAKTARLFFVIPLASLQLPGFEARIDLSRLILDFS